MNILVIGSGISGLCTAIEAANLGHHVKLVSPVPSERSQSVMAAGGINAYSDRKIDGRSDSSMCHAEDTWKGGCCIENEDDIQAFCRNAPDCIKFLDELGVRFNKEEDGSLSRRAFGGQSRKRTAYAGASTGKQIVTGLINKCREFEIKGLIERCLYLQFYSALIREGVCYGALIYDEQKQELRPFYADAIVIATGGQNRVFGKTTGSSLCDGYAAARLLSQGVKLRNLEFIQYHPTSIETDHKRMLITEAARGEGGRLFYLKENGQRCYFMEEEYGPNGNLMPRDIVSRCIYRCPSQVYLDISFLGEKLIHERLDEVYQLCKEYIDLDVTKKPIPVAPAVHFFMGGIRVDRKHQTNIERLYAVGECASKYHGANRLGGNSLLAAVYSGKLAARSIHEAQYCKLDQNGFEAYICAEQEKLEKLKSSKSVFPSVYIMNELSSIMNHDLGIEREGHLLEEGLSSIRFYRQQAEKMRFDSSISLYENYRIPYLLLLGEAILMSANARMESRGAHYRLDHPQSRKEFQAHSVIEYTEQDGWMICFDVDRTETAI